MWLAADVRDAWCDLRLCIADPTMTGHTRGQVCPLLAALGRQMLLREYQSGMYSTDGIDSCSYKQFHSPLCSE